MYKQIAYFHYLTQDLPDYTHEQQVKIACENGVKWIQLRVKNKNIPEWLEVARRAREITTLFKTVLIINDNIEIARNVDADGIHLGRNDTHWTEARKILGDEKIIGFSIHSIKELENARDYDVDYFGVGPFRFTSTKENLDPILGIEGIEKMVAKSRAMRILKPLIAIGGIQSSDVTPLLHTGVEGIAVSSAIHSSQNPSRAILKFLEKIKAVKSVEKGMTI